MTEWLPAWTRGEGVDRAAAGFRDHFGDEPAGVWAAPGRVNIIGEHTDYNAGLCLPMALDHRTYVALTPRTDSQIRLASGELSELWRGDLGSIEPGKTRGWGAYAAGVAWAMDQADLPMTGFNAFVTSCVPFGAGLSSSAALECAFAVALDTSGIATSRSGRKQLVTLCMRAENEIAGAPTGGLDQSASLLCQTDQALLLDFSDGSDSPVPFALADHGLELLVIDTRAKHALDDGQYGSRREQCEQAAQILDVSSLRDIIDLEPALAVLADQPVLAKRVRHVFTENARTVEFTDLLRQGRYGELGPLLDASHASLRDDYEVSVGELDTAVDAAKAAGALGARMTGGGFGGSAIALIPAGTADQVAEAVVSAFAAAGFPNPPAFLTSLPAAGADRVK